MFPHEYWVKKNEDHDIDSHHDRGTIDMTIPNAIRYKMQFVCHPELLIIYPYKYIDNFIPLIS